MVEEPELSPVNAIGPEKVEDELSFLPVFITLSAIAIGARESTRSSMLSDLLTSPLPKEKREFRKTGESFLMKLVL